MITINESLHVLNDENQLGSVVEAIQAHPDKLHEICNALGAAFSAAQTRGTAVAQSLAVKLNEVIAAAEKATTAAAAEHAANLEEVSRVHIAETQADIDLIIALKAELAAAKAEHAAYKEAASKGADMIDAVIADPTKDDATTVAAITAIVAYAAKVANKTAHEREIEALNHELDELAKKAAETAAKRDALAQA